MSKVNRSFPLQIIFNVTKNVIIFFIQAYRAAYLEDSKNRVQIREDNKSV